MESSSSNSPPSSVFQFCSNDELQYICELLSSSDPISSPHADDSIISHYATPPHLHSMLHHLPPPSLLLPSDPPPPNIRLPLCSPVHPTSSSHLSSHNAFSSTGFTKRDWLSSLSQSPPSFCPASNSGPPPPRRLLPSLSSSFANPCSLQIASSTPSLCPRPPLSTKDLQNFRSVMKLRHHLNPDLKDSPNIEASGKQCDGDDLPPSKAQGSTLGTNAYGVVLRLSDVKAALQAKPFDSHRSNSANAASKSAPTFTLNSFNSANPRTSSTTISAMNRTIQPALLTACSLNTSTEILKNVDEWLQGSCANAQFTGPIAESLKVLESKKRLTLATMLSGEIQNTRKGQRQMHICTDRERRRGMKDLYRTLHSLLPDTKIKGDRGSVLSGTMEYIKSLVKQLDELEQKKVRICSENLELQKSSNENEGKKLVSGAKIDDVVGCIMVNENEGKKLDSIVATRTEVDVSFIGEDAFINVCTSKRKGVWSSLLELLQQLDIYILNVTLSTGPTFYHHRIHAKVSSTFKLNSIALQQKLTTFVG